MSAREQLNAWQRGFYAQIMTAPHFAPVRHLFTEPVASLKEHKDFFWAHNRVMWAMIRNLSDKAINIMVDGIDDYIRNHLKIPASGLSDGGQVEARANALSAHGYVEMPKIDAKKVAAMVEYFETQDCYPGNYNPNPTLYSLEQARKERPYIAHYPLESVLGCPNFLAIANHPALISTVAKYLGTIPTVVDYSAWWSFAHRAAPEKAQLFHFDLADYRFCTLMLYLTDVDEGAGPHKLIDGSHNFSVIRSLQEKASDQEAFDHWYFVQHRKTDEEVKEHFGQGPVTLTGSAGTSHLLVPRTIHKGVMPTETDRLVCQVVYSCAPQLQNELRTIEWGSDAVMHLPKWIAAEPFRYINRLFIEFN
ncbi:MAG: hypothetical protein RIB59_09980 [Rhodospirillales bacterium]